MRYLLILAFVLSACASPRVAVEHASDARADASANYRDFASAEDVAAYLAPDSEAGVLISAHRGGPQPGYPENAIASFERALTYAPVLPEVDVRLTQDSVLVLLHDDTLGRTTTATGDLAATTLAETRRMLLRDNDGATTPFRIPTLAEALAWAEGRAILQLDVKRGVPARSVVDAIRAAEAEDQAVVIVYSLGDLRRYYSLAPDLVYSATARTVEQAEALVAAGRAGEIDLDRLVVFTGVGTLDGEVIAVLHDAGLRPILGTFGDIDEAASEEGPGAYADLVRRGVGIIATDNVPVASEIVR
jgi:glycerophosphoryl diester phosphodiesterase